MKTGKWEIVDVESGVSTIPDMDPLAFHSHAAAETFLASQAGDLPVGCYQIIFRVSDSD